MKKIAVTYLIAVFAGVVSFLLALNLRQIVVDIYIISRAGDVPWAASLVNAIAMIVLMLGWIIYTFYTHNYFENKCEFSLNVYIRASLKLVLPVVVMYLLSAIYMLI